MGFMDTKKSTHHECTLIRPKMVPNFQKGAYAYRNNVVHMQLSLTDSAHQNLMILGA